MNKYKKTTKINLIKINLALAETIQQKIPEIKH